MSRRTAQTLLDNPLVKEWHVQLSRQRESTAALYLQSLWGYWNSVKSRGFKDIGQYVEEVKDQQKSDDPKVRRRWATDLLTFFDTYILAKSGRPLTTETRKSGSRLSSRFWSITSDNWLVASYLE